MQIPEEIFLSHISGCVVPFLKGVWSATQNPVSVSHWHTQIQVQWNVYPVAVQSISFLSSKNVLFLLIKQRTDKLIACSPIKLRSDREQLKIVVFVSFIPENPLYNFIAS